jgi:hypothetical protein
MFGPHQLLTQAQPASGSAAVMVAYLHSTSTLAILKLRNDCLPRLGECLDLRSQCVGAENRVSSFPFT